MTVVPAAADVFAVVVVSDGVAPARLTAEGCVEVVASEEDSRRAARELVDAAAALAAYDGDRDDASAAVVIFG